MVATRRGTRVEPQDEGDRSAAEQTPEEVISPTSPMQTRRSVRKDGQADEKSADEGKSMVTNRSPLKSETVKHSIQISTRSRHRSGQSDADVSEAESTTSNASTRRSSSRQSIGQLTDSTRKLRSLRSALITEPIIESKEDAELSEAESNCSSVSTTARRKLPGTASRSVSTRSRRSLLISEPTSDVSDAESNSSVLGVKTIVTRSTRSSSRRSLSLVSEPQKEQTSDAESCSSGFSLQPLARRSSRRNKSNLQSDEVTFVSENNEDDALDQKSPKIHDVKSDAPSSLGEHSVISSPRRSLRNQPAIQEDEVIIVSDDECESSNTKNQVLVIDQQEVEESSLAKEADLPVETSAMSSLQSSKTQPEVINLPDQMLGLSDDSVNEEPATEKSHMTNDDGDATEETIENIQDMPEDTNMADSIRLVIDSDDSEKSEHSDDDDDDEEDENNMEVEEEDHDQVVEKRKSQKTSKQQLQNVAGDGLFVIDTAPGVDSSKKYFLEPEDSDDDKEDENETREKGEIPEPDIDDDDDDDFIDKDEDEDEEEALLNRPKSGFALSTSIDTGISLKEMGGLYISFDSEKPNAGPGLLSKMKKGNQKKDELLQKSVITPDFEKKECVPPYTESKNKLKKKRQEEREKTTGRGWFDMKAPELTDELKNDLKALKMRSAMDPKHFYKKNDREGFPKYFQVGTVVDSPVDFYHSRIPKKQRKRTIVEELLADSEFRRYNKKKFKEIIAEKAARAEGKKNRKKKKFRT